MFKIRHGRKKRLPVAQDIQAVWERFGSNIAAVDIHLLVLEGEFIEVTSMYDFAVFSFNIPLKVVNQLQDRRSLIHITEKYETKSPNHMIW